MLLYFDYKVPFLAATTTVQAPPRVGSLTLNAVLGEPDILLIEDARNPADTKALILKVCKIMLFSKYSMLVHLLCVAIY